MPRKDVSMFMSPAIEIDLEKIAISKMIQWMNLTCKTFCALESVFHAAKRKIIREVCA